MKDKLIIIGASITGTFAMTELVRQKFDGTITVIEEQETLPYNPYPLSKEWMMDRKDMEPPLLKKESYYKDHNIDLRLNTRVELVNSRDKTVTTNRGDIIPYDYLIIATGSSLRKLDLAGDDARGIFYLGDFQDAKKIKNWLEDSQKLIIIGTGFIGLELASTFAQLGKDVTVLVRSGKPLEKIFGSQLSDYFIEMHEGHGVKFLFNEEAKEFIKDSRGELTSILTKGGKTIGADMAIIAVGVEPNISFELDSLDKDGGVLVNKFGETSLPNIYAGGDVAVWPYRGKMVHIEHWEVAWSQGISIAKNIVNERSNEYEVDPYFWTDQYDETFEYIGNAVEWDKTIIRGSLDGKKFAVAYLDKDNYPLAILFANEFEERGDVEELIQSKKPLAVDKFKDPTVDILQSIPSN